MKALGGIDLGKCKVLAKSKGSRSWWSVLECPIWVVLGRPWVEITERGGNVVRPCVQQKKNGVAARRRFATGCEQNAGDVFILPPPPEKRGFKLSTLTTAYTKMLTSPKTDLLLHMSPRIRTFSITNPFHYEPFPSRTISITKLFHYKCYDIRSLYYTYEPYDNGC